MKSSGPESTSPRLGPDDPRYGQVVDKRFNKRFRATPDYVRLARSTADVAGALEEAAREGRRLAVTSGGHCLEGFVSDSEVKVILDVSAMKAIAFDPERRAFSVEAGATVGETFQALAERWGVVVPLGEYPGIGMGGHAVGGAFGFLCRELGLAADYLYAVEVVTVGAEGKAEAIVATREESDPHRELWWAHTGGGGGNFGVVTRYWFRSTDATGDDPRTLLPPAPESITTFAAEWKWDDLDQAAFERLLRNHGRWCEENGGADSPNATLCVLLSVHRKQFGKIALRGLSTAGDSADGQIEELLAALGEGLPAPGGRKLETMSWLDFALNPFPELFGMPPGGVSLKAKDALLKKRLTDRQIAMAYPHLIREDRNVPGGMLGLLTYGGKINTVAPGATASAARGAILDIACNAGWIDPKDEAEHLAWVRAFYLDLFVETGGVPLPGEAYDGALINHPDTDFLDGGMNTSGVPWSTLYYQGNYPRLQEVKRRYDPGNFFRHALSIRG